MNGNLTYIHIHVHLLFFQLNIGVMRLVKCKAIDDILNTCSFISPPIRSAPETEVGERDDVRWGLGVREEATGGQLPEYRVARRQPSQDRQVSCWGELLTQK